MPRTFTMVVALWLLLASPCLLAQSDASDAGKSISEVLRSGDKFLKAQGTGLPADWANTPAEKEVSALEAARVVAKANLLETVVGVSLDIKKKVNNNQVKESQIISRAEGLLQGAQVYKTTYNAQKGIAEAYSRMSIKGRGGLYHMLVPLLGSATQDLNLTEYQGQPDSASQADGLIIDVRDFFDFEPALVQFILSEQGEVLYGPDKVSQRMLAKRGMAAYNNDPGKASAILSEMGSKNPLMIKATGLSGNRPQASKEDAASIFSANQNKHFLEKARVVFLLEN